MLTRDMAFLIGPISYCIVFTVCSSLLIMSSHRPSKMREGRHTDRESPDDAVVHKKKKSPSIFKFDFFRNRRGKATPASSPHRGRSPAPPVKNNGKEVCSIEGNSILLYNILPAVEDGSSDDEKDTTPGMSCRLGESTHHPHSRLLRPWHSNIARRYDKDDN